MRQQIIIYTVLVVAMICLSYYLWCDCNCSQNYICKAAIKPVKESLGFGAELLPRKPKKVILTTTTEKEEVENFDETTPDPDPEPKKIIKTTRTIYTV